MRVRRELEDALARVDRPKSNADLRRGIEALRVVARDAFDDAVAVLRDPSWDRPLDLVGRWGHGPPKEQVWKALLDGAGAERVERLWFLSEHPDPYVRSTFVADALSTGHVELLDRAGALLRDKDKELREHAAIGLRNAVRDGASGVYRERAAGLLLDYVRRFPKDADVARLTALHLVDPAKAAEAERVLEAVHRPDPSSDWFVLRGGDLEWGDYGFILVHGMASRNQAGVVRLERTGPFVPPITVPGLGVVCVTAEGRRALEGAGLSGLDYRPVDLARVVRCHWHEWDLDADEPALHPSSGEPEDYVLGPPHDVALAQSMPAVFEVVVPEGAADDVDVFRRGPYQFTASRRAKEFIESAWPRWVRFENLV